MISRPQYLTQREGPEARAREWIEEQAKQWAKEYLENDVQALQKYKQHHVHIYNDETEKTGATDRMPA